MLIQKILITVKAGLGWWLASAGCATGFVVAFLEALKN